LFTKNTPPHFISCLRACYCSLFYAAVLKFLRCRSADDAAIYRLECQLPDQVIRIKSALVAFSQKWNSSSDRLACVFRNLTCVMFTRHDEIATCNGQHSCSLSQDVFDFPENRSRCRTLSHANFIVIIYYCSNGKNDCFFSPHFTCFSIFIYFCRFCSLSLSGKPN